MKKWMISVSLISLLGAGLSACNEDSNDQDGAGGQGGAGTASGGSSSTSGGSTASGGASSGPRGKASPPKLGAQIDRMGRPAINTALNHTFSADADAKDMKKDEYNALAREDWPMFEAEMKANLAILDGLDQTCGNQLAADQTAGERYAFLAGVLADDRLFVNADAGECGVYLGVEAEVLGVIDPGDGKCGGRSPADDVIERSYSVLAAGILSGVDDGVTENDADFSDEFPFLAAPH